MPSAVDIANIALSHIGADAVVTSLSPTDGSVESGHCARFLPIARQAAIATANWNFARTRVLLAELTNDSGAWLFKYQVPSDCLRARKILALNDPDTPERNGEKFVLEGTAIYTDRPEATLIYTRDITDTTKYPPDFVSALGLMLAGYVAGPLIKGVEGTRISKALMDSAMDALRTAAAQDGNAGMERAEFTPASLSARA